MTERDPFAASEAVSGALIWAFVAATCFAVLLKWDERPAVPKWIGLAMGEASPGQWSDAGLRVVKTRDCPIMLSESLTIITDSAGKQWVRPFFPETGKISQSALVQSVSLPVFIDQQVPEGAAMIRFVAVHKCAFRRVTSYSPQWAFEIR